MQIYTDPHTKEHYSFDSQAYLRFLMAQGFTEPEIDDLTVRLERVSDEAPYRACQGYYRHSTCTICVWSRNRYAVDMDDTLLHETRHCWQFLRGTHCFSAEKNIAYFKRSYEIDARQFAKAHAGQHFFQRTSKRNPAEEARLVLVSGMFFLSENVDEYALYLSKQVHSFFK